MIRPRGLDGGYTRAVDGITFLRWVADQSTKLVAYRIDRYGDRKAAEMAADLPSRRAAAAELIGTAPTEGCPACTVHEELSKARGHAEGIVAVVDEEGEIPGVMRPTVLLARSNLTAARSAIADVRRRAPSLTMQCDQLERDIDMAAIELPAPSGLTPENARESLATLTRCHLEATKLAVAFYQLESDVHGSAELKAVYEDAVRRNLPADAFYARLKEVL